MADSFVQLATDGTGKKVDTRTESTNLEHRQVFVIGDPATNAGVAPVDATNGLAVDVKASALPTGAATSAKQDTGNTSVASIDTKTPALGQALAAASVPVVLPAATVTTLTPPAAITGFATETTLGTRLSESDFDTKTGSLTETAPTTDTASSGLNGRLQRIAQRITSLITAIGTPFQAGGSIGNTAFTANAGTNLNTSSLALEAGGNLATIAGKDFATQTTLALVKAKTDNIDVALSTRTKPADIQNVTQNAATTPTATTIQAAAVANGNGTNLPVTGYATAVLNIVSSVAMSGGTTINFEASVDDTTWVSITGQLSGTSTFATTATADGDYRFNSSGYKSIRARISAYSAGTITVKGYTNVNAGKPTAIQLATGANTIGALTANQSVNVSQINGVTPLMGNGVTGTGSMRVTIASDNTAIPVASHNVTNAGTFATQSTLVSATTGGATAYKLVSAATTNATSVKGSAGTVYMVTASNVNAAVRYLKLYNKATAPTVGTDTPVLTFAIPGNTAGAGTNIPVPAMGIDFATGIALALTTEATDVGTTAVALSEIVVNLAYK